MTLIRRRISIKVYAGYSNLAGKDIIFDLNLYTKTTFMTRFTCFLSFCLLFLLFTPSKFFAQNGFLSGLLVTATGDTLHGLIRHQDLMVNGKNVSFKDNAAAPARNFGPLEARWFFVDGQWFAGKVVWLDRSPVQAGQLTYSNAPVLQRDTLFLRAPVLGRANLFYVLDANNKPHFLIGKDSVEAEELVLRKYLVRDQGQDRAVTLEKYKGQLGYYFADCPAVKENIDGTTYQLNSMIRLFGRYNYCAAGKVDFVVSAEKSRIHLQLILLGGATFSQLNVDAPSDSPLSQGSFGISTRPALGLGLNFVFPWNNNRWSVYLETVTRSLSADTHVPVVHNSEYYEDYEYRFHLNYLKTSAALRFQEPEGRIRPFAMIGVARSLLLSSSNDLIINKNFYGTKDMARRQAIPAGLSGAEFAFFGGLGATYRHFSLETRFDLGGGISNSQSFPSSTRTISLLLGYRF